MDTAAIVRDARRGAGLSQAQLGARAGTSQATVSAYEAGRKQPSVTTLDRLLRATGRRLAVEAADALAREPTRAELAQAGRGLAQVIALAEALPVRHEPTLRFPRLGRRTAA